jgi:hypothetical protein
MTNIPEVHKGDNRSLCHLMNVWWNTGQLVSTSFFVSLLNALANTSVHIDQQHSSKPKERPETLTLYSKSIHCLQTRLQTIVDGLNESVIMSVLTFAYYDVRSSVSKMESQTLTNG